MSDVVRLSNRYWVGVLCTTVLIVGGLYAIIQNQQAKINDVAITQAVTAAQLEAIARVQERILSRLEALEQQ